ncbi:SDR family oxidoreductase [Jannaschia seohaensis]|uniref:NADP-dependent 3-hydroxy acid dehydrogenase YdfG n=1 Tax=Jannaschia seohaensis TaxID=475081 RepID=A0A2Y9A3G1_9RHOB|nr:SDR family oxidoreductase [Jannaschia seohaensis]PWJ22108.1 NADP-dependent 3-hydroxy acid dehydrogenase YdfG [Jannaschia seohaensis]SSA38386.1 NADP-dependent 3-hydroxy acid dehydrogenase YdfG [Jannaschia seohaensis]
MKSILITGASSGIGAATAKLFLAESWRVGLMARREEALREVADGHERAVVLPGDVTDPKSVEAVFDRFCEGGPLDVLFNNAGVFMPAAPIDRTPVRDWNEAVAVNLTGMFLAARAAFARMRAQGGGRIVNNGSISAHVPREGAVTYTVTKHAITGLTKQLSLDGRELGIACGQIDIGNARTPMLEALDAVARLDGGAGVPMMDVEDAARAVLHMASLPPEANVLTMTIMANAMPYVGRG